MKVLNKIFIPLICFQLLIPGLVYSAAAAPATKNTSNVCHDKKSPDTFTLLCKNIDDVVCKKTPDSIRRSCDETEHTIVHTGMTANEVYNFASGCISSAARSFAAFFTEFLPDLCKAIWDLSKDAYEKVSSPGLIDSLKGYYESARSLAADVYEAVKKDPGQFFTEIWNKITAAVSPLIDQYDCLNPQTKVEKICGLITEWVMPPAILAKVIVRGTKAAKELISLKLISKAREVKAVPKLTKSIPAASTTLGKSPELDAFKAAYAKELKLTAGANKDFIKQVELDAAVKESRAIYFDVENSVQKTLNDQVFAEKTVVDAINNSFFLKFDKNLRSNPDLMSRLEGEYKDYKSYRIRLKLKPGDDPKKYEDMLAALYKKTSEDFVTDQALLKVAKQIPPRTDGLSDPRQWFLSGAGENSLEANMAARSARKTVSTQPARLTHFREHVASLGAEIESIDQLRTGLAANQKLLEKHILEKAANGNIIPSKSMIGILRKIKPSEFTTEEAFLAKVRQKTKELFGESIDESTSRSLALYFKKVDALSPPLFSAERVVIDLKKAEKGIVSVDFAGIGVDNIYEQMKVLTEVELKKGSAEKRLSDSFIKMQEGVNQVTHQMNEAKASFDKAVSKVEKSDKNKTLFSGDDGIFMPSGRVWGETQKSELVAELARSSDPSKYRVTFVSSHFPDGKIIPVSDRSKRIVRAESVEKDMRAKIIGVNKISDREAKKIISAIDYTPEENGGVFNLIIGGKTFSTSEIQEIEKAFKSTIKSENGERFGKLIIK